MRLDKIDIKGFKSIGEEQHICLGSVTVLLGANGSGKSNLVSFFKLLNYMTTEALQTYVGKYGVSQLLFYGPPKTESISFRLHFSSETVNDIYEVKLSHGLPDRLFISGEKITYHKKGSDRPFEHYLRSGGTESELAQDKGSTSRIIYSLLSNIRTYQFHNTSDTAKIIERGYIDDAKYLRSDGGNLAAFLKMLKEHQDYRCYYERTIRHIQRIMPQFGDFSLEGIPGNENYVRLNWTDSDKSDYLFGPDQISDGSLRFMALATLLLQPPSLLPRFIVLDEPELGLHPTAISDLASMIRNVTAKSQILIATQSTRLVEEFNPEEIIVVERDEKKKSSVFRQLDSDKLKAWLECYSISELWEKNVLGGQP